MHVHILSDSAAKLSQVRGLIDDACDVTTELLDDSTMSSSQYDAVIAAVDIRRPENIVALKEMSQGLARVPKRVFLLDRRSRLSTMQSFALGATTVLTTPINRTKLRAELFGRQTSGDGRAALASDGVRVAALAAEYVSSMFRSVMHGTPIDAQAAVDVANGITSRVAEEGLSSWLKTVRDHHKGTYQHCLLVSGVAADFGLSLGLGAQDMERLGLAAILHDVGKADIPLSVLDKPGRLDNEERKLIETHPAIGYRVLKNSPGISDEVLDAVRHHHEYLDGSGYPDGLVGESISDLTRILTISDIFAALIEYRTYKPMMPREKAFEILQSMQGKLEMPLVSAFRDVALSR